MSITQRVALLTLYTSHRGRISQKTFWLWFYLPIGVLGTLATQLDMLLGIYDVEEEVRPVSGSSQALRFSEAYQPLGILVPERQFECLDRVPYGQPSYLLEPWVRIQALLKPVVWDLRIQVMYVMDSDACGDPL